MTPPATRSVRPTDPTARPASGPDWRDVARWSLTALAVPPAGLAAITVVGRVDDVGSALVGGLVAGVGVGLGQGLVLRRWSPRPASALLVRWTGATAMGFALGLVVGSGLVAYRTSPGALALMGAVTGMAVGLGQAPVLRWGSVVADARLAATWALAQAPLWALGWLTTAAAGIDVDRQYAVFGLSGALVSSLLAGALLGVLRHRGEVSGGR